MKEALYYEKIEDLKVHCHLCPNECIINHNNLGICLNRKNIDGTLFTLNYSQVSSVAADPIEKKPLYHFLPGKHILSFGTSGCSLKCDFCQNSNISMSGPEITEKMTPEECADLAVKENYEMIAYTYNEPFIWFEHVLECAEKSKNNNVKNILVTNGYYNQKPFEELIPFIDAMNIDLKAFTDDFYKKYCKAELEPVKTTIKNAYGKTHIEITTLIIPGLNDNEDEFRNIVDFIAGIDVEIPYHISRYYPRYKRDNPATSERTLRWMHDIAKEKLKYVYIGNIGGFDSNTYCSSCNELLIKRNFYTTSIEGLKYGKCIKCGQKLFGVFE